MEGGVYDVEFPITGGVHDVDASENRVDYEKLARFAVDDHNKKQNGVLEFKKVVKVQEQVVAGAMYYITLEAHEGDKKKLYEAQIWEKVWENFLEVQEFKHIGDAPAA